MKITCLSVSWNKSKTSDKILTNKLIILVTAGLLEYNVDLTFENLCDSHYEHNKWEKAYGLLNGYRESIRLHSAHGKTAQQTRARREHPPSKSVSRNPRWGPDRTVHSGSASRGVAVNQVSRSSSTVWTPFCWTARSCQNRSQKEEIEAAGFERKKETVSISRWHECVHGNPHLQKSIDHHADLMEPWISELVVMSSDTGAARGQAQVPEETGSRSSLHELGSPQPWSLFRGCFSKWLFGRPLKKQCYTHTFSLRLTLG